MNCFLYCPGLHGRHKLHELYMDWLAAKGEWGPCVMAIRCSKSNTTDHEDLYSFVSKQFLEEKLGAELAKDLIHRHTEAEKKLPASQKGKFIRSILDCTINMKQGRQNHTGTIM